jgi:uncharacterized membrane protein HdeD (DUF308 family)
MTTRRSPHREADGADEGGDMTASMSGTHAGTSPSASTGMRIAVAVLGLATVVVGVVLLFDPVKAAHTLALLLGAALIVSGLLELAVGWRSRSRSRGGTVVLGGILVVGGLLAMAWPGVTLQAIALITGLSLLAHGIGRVVLAVATRREVRGWPWLALAGAFGILVGVLALVWPDVTVRVLCFVLGAQVTAFGLLLMAAAFLPYGTTTSRVPAGA